MKTCRHCKHALDASRFYADASRTDGLSRLCRPCTLVERAKFRAANREKLRTQASEDRRTHPESGCYRQMIERCSNERHHCWANYGGRGIRVCERWLSSFDDFLADVGPRPSLQHSLDRIDVNGNSEPGNVRWATATVQMRNMRRNRVLELNGRRQTLSAWAEELGVNSSLIKDRVDRLGWPVDRALTTPPHPCRRSA